MATCLLIGMCGISNLTVLSVFNLTETNAQIDALQLEGYDSLPFLDLSIFFSVLSISTSCRVEMKHLWPHSGWNHRFTLSVPFYVPGFWGGSSHARAKPRMSASLPFSGTSCPWFLLTLAFQGSQLCFFSL